MKICLTFASAISILIAGLPNTASAQIYNSMVANPFAFCSLPKPCKYCQPWRKIYTEICAEQADAGKGASASTTASSPIIETVDQDGKKWYLRTINGYTLRTDQRVDLEDASLNSGKEIEGLEVVGHPNDAQLLR